MIGRLLSLLLAVLLLAAPAQASGGGDGGDKDGAPTFVRFEPIIVPLFDDTRVAGMMSVTVTLQVPKPEDKDAIEARRIRYIDAFNTALMQLGRLKLDPRRPLDVRLLANELQRAADRTHGKPGLKAFVVDASARKL